MRLFVSINFDAETVDFLYDKVQKLRRHALSMSPSPRENLHLTLAFIGETEKPEAAKAALDKIAFEKLEKFDFYLSGLGKFPTADGDIYWVGAEEAEELISLADAVRKSLTDAGFTIDKKKFSPHVTLGRRVICKEPPTFGVPRRRVSAAKISLMRSERGRGRMIYTEIHKVDLL